VASTSAAKKQPKPEISAEEKARIDAERRARLAEQVRNTGILKLLGQGRWIWIHCRRSRQGRRGPRPGKGIPGVGGLTVATSDASLRGVNLAPAALAKWLISAACAGGHIASGNTGAGATEKRVSVWSRARHRPWTASWIRPGFQGSPGAHRRGQGLLRAALKRNPNLSGKIKVRWTITAAGTVSGVDIADDSMGDSEYRAASNNSWHVGASQHQRAGLLKSSSHLCSPHLSRGSLG